VRGAGAMGGWRMAARTTKSAPASARRRAALGALLVAAGLAGAAGCSGGGGSGHRVLPASARGPFIALERDFRDLRDWERFDLADRPAQGLTHTRGKRRIYLNARPAEGGTFPVGTILVKELLGDVHPDHKFFAMVKRGSGYNARGALGWEWFELRDRGSGHFTIAWRGLDAPSGEGYGGGAPGGEVDPLGGCNSCHGLSSGNDYVRADALELPTLIKPAS